ncbi:hypothetical protein PIROE2DRAFT_10006 [Piromyces sp. E2]|nr:hypothetical protein PIROE2DRAFT_10006 [Piromyces sp. E2]|eukprot:OUM63460.1 hypothetical protein PIROE2DRAFT_10006 [Piromyces sp. E2]
MLLILIKITITNIEVQSLPKIFNPLYKNGINKYQYYEDNQIYTVYTKCDETIYSYLKYNPFVNSLKNDNEANCEVTFVVKTDVYQRTDKLQLIGFDSRGYKNGVNDPTLMRDKFSIELHKAVDVPTYSSAYARVTINNNIYGLYCIIDSVNSKCLAPNIHDDDEARIGTSYKTFAGANLKYLDEGAYIEIPNTKKNQTKTTVKALEKFFNLKSLFRQMTYSGNFLIYYNPEQNKYQIIPYDFDNFFCGNVNTCDAVRVDKSTYFISTLFKQEFIKNRYNEIMKETVEKVYNVDSIPPLIDSLSTLIEDDITWNIGLIDKLDSSIKNNTNFKTVGYNPSINYNDANFGIKKWIHIRSNLCKNYSKKISKNIIKSSITISCGHEYPHYDAIITQNGYKIDYYYLNECRIPYFVKIETPIKVVTSTTSTSSKIILLSSKIIITNTTISSKAIPTPIKYINSKN